MLRRFAAALVAAVTACGGSACEVKKSANPLTPTVAGPLPGVQITAPKMVDPPPGARIAVDKQPITLTVENAATNGVRPLNYAFDVASDASFTNKIFTREGIAPGDGGRTSVKLPSALATGHTYYWRARAQDGANTGAFAAAASFEVYTPIVINAPALVSPAANATVASLRPRFTITDAPRSGPVGAITYLIELSNSSTFATKTTWTFAEQVGQTSFDTPTDLQPSKVYYWHVRAADPKTVGPFSETRGFATPAAPPPPPPAGGGGPAPNDAINLGLATIENSPSDVARWPATATITRLDLGQNGVHIDFTKKDGPGSWPDVPFVTPGETLQYTLWIVLNINGRWYASGCIQFWRGLDRNGGPPSQYGQNWYYDPIRWGPMAGHQPATGEMVGFLVTAGDARNNGHVIVKERSNVVMVPFPTSGGVFTFSSGHLAR